MNLIKKFVALCLACSFPVQFSQPTVTFTHGTIVVIMVMDDRIVASADSREIKTGDTTGASTLSSDSTCKLFPLGKSMFFTASGIGSVAENRAGKLSYVFRAGDVSRQAFHKFSGEEASDLRTKKMATYWGQTVRDQIQHMIATHQNPPATDNEYLTGIFVSSSRDKQWSVYEVPIKAELAKDRKIVTYAVTPLTAPIPYTVELGSSHNMVKEFFTIQTKRSIVAQQKMGEIIKSHPNVDSIAFSLEFAILTAEKWEPNNPTFGGKVDVLELKRDGGVHWVKVKENCR